MLRWSSSFTPPWRGILFNRLLKNYCAALIRACAVLGILMYSLCTLRFLCSGRSRLKPARDVFQQPVKGLSNLSHR